VGEDNEINEERLQHAPAMTMKDEDGDDIGY